MTNFSELPPYVLEGFTWQSPGTINRVGYYNPETDSYQILTYGATGEFKGSGFIGRTEAYGRVIASLLVLVHTAESMLPDNDFYRMEIERSGISNVSYT